MRRKKILLITYAVLLCSACSYAQSDTFLPSPSAVSEAPVYSSLGAIETDDDIIVPFNTTVRLETLSEEDMALLDPLFQKEMTECSMLFDRRHNYDGIINIASINGSYGSEQTFTVDSRLFDLLQKGIELTQLTDGRFNITIGSVYDLWRDKFSPFPIEGEDPPAEEIEEALKCVVPSEQIGQVIELDSENNTVTLHKYDGCEAGVVIDAGAIGKGYAVDMTGEKLKQKNVPFLINSGSSSIMSYTVGEQQKDWYIGVRNPYARVYTLFDYKLSDSGVFTVSGDDSSYFIRKTDEGQIIRHHILNPLTGYPENYLRSVILTGPEKGWLTDALTTALFSCKDDSERLSLIRAAEDVYGVTLDYAWFEETGEEQGILTVSEDFRKNIIATSISTNVIEIKETE